MDFLKDHAASIGAAVTAVGGVAYVLLTIISSWVYDPVGVAPGEVGLGYGPMLIGAAAFLSWIAVIGGLLVAITIGVASLTPRLGRWLWVLVVLFATVSLVALTADASIAALIAAVPLAAVASRRWPGRRYLASAVISVTVAFVSGVALASWMANQARDQITAGSQNSGFWSGPWTARVVTVHATASSSSLRVPSDRCLLYLGEANGRSVLYDASLPVRTFRLPTSEMLIEIRPDARDTRDC